MPITLGSYKTRRGNIPYDLLGSEMTESFEGSDGSSASATLVTTWENRAELIRALLEDVEVQITPEIDPPTNLPRPLLKRLLPEPHPLYPWMFASKAYLLRPLGYPSKPSEGSPASFKFRRQFTSDAYAEIRVDFAARPYRVDVPDQTAHAPQLAKNGEFLRYVERVYLPSAEAFQVGGTGFRFVDNGQTIGVESPARVNPLSTLKMIWHCVPKRYLPRTVTVPGPGFTEQGLLGRVNSGFFDLPSETFDRRSYPPHTILWLALEYSRHWHTLSGVEVLDVEYTFQFRSTGWHKIYKRTANNFIEVSTDGQPQGTPGDPDNLAEWDAVGAKHLFRYRNLNRLFRLES